MGQAGAGDQQMRRVGMIDRRENAALRQQGGRIDLAAAGSRLDQLGDGGPPGDRGPGQVEDRMDAAADDP